MKSFKYIMSGLLIFFFCFHQTVFAQSATEESGLGTHSKILVAVLIIIVAAIFIGLEVMNNPKYEILAVENEETSITKSSLNIEYKFDNKISYFLRIGFYCSIILSIFYLLIIILILKVI